MSFLYEFSYHYYCEHVDLGHTHIVFWQVHFCWSQIGSVTASPSMSRGGEVWVLRGRVVESKEKSYDSPLYIGYYC